MPDEPQGRREDPCLASFLASFFLRRFFSWQVPTRQPSPQKGLSFSPIKSNVKSALGHDIHLEWAIGLSPSLHCSTRPLLPLLLVVMTAAMHRSEAEVRWGRMHMETCTRRAGTTAARHLLSRQKCMYIYIYMCVCGCMCVCVCQSYCSAPARGTDGADTARPGSGTA